jgi:hypothetical protein
VSEQRPVSDPDTETDIEGQVVGSGLTFEGKLDNAIIWDVLHAPLKVLGGLSWVAAYTQVLQQAKDWLRSEGCTGGLLVFTGRASGMAFTRGIAKQVFGETFAVHVGKEPEYSVARGLVLYGRWKWRVEHFRKAVKDLCDSDEIAKLAKQHLPEMMRACFDVLWIALLERVFILECDKWIRHQVEVSEAEDHKTIIKERDGDEWIVHRCGVTDYFTQKAYDLLRNPQVQDQFSAEFAGDRSKLAAAIKEKTDPICDRFGIDRAALRMSLEKLGEDMPLPARDNPLDRIAWLLEKYLPNFGRNVVGWPAKVALKTALFEARHIGFSRSYMAVGMKIATFLDPIDGSTTGGELIEYVRQQVREELEALAERALYQIH